ncbi:hypothetical protein NPIL_328261 [Nephila pilipes]|uniref:Uncharacterized protein n=1 Tax=Nephila pilipes TaxID=299642 RepID=A0A8X6TR28_NEPPI|nr:hypothetical protein NPIL_328261 [Nephila pilipes]
MILIAFRSSRYNSEESQNLPSPRGQHRMTAVCRIVVSRDVIPQSLISSPPSVSVTEEQVSLREAHPFTSTAKKCGKSLERETISGNCRE